MSDVTLIAEERASGSRASATSRSDGSFSLDLPVGVYDITLDRENDASTATCFYGPVEALADLDIDFLLRSSVGRAPQSVFGVIQQRLGQPAGFQRVRFVSTVVHSDSTDHAVPEAEETTTSASGEFEIAVDSSEALSGDLEIYDASGLLREFDDIEKREKPVYVQIATEASAIDNRLRSDESELPGLLAPGNGAAWRPFQTLTPDFDEDREDATLTASNGSVPVGTGEVRLSDLIDTSSPAFGAMGYLRNDFLTVVRGKTSPARMYITATGVEYEHELHFHVDGHNGYRLTFHPGAGLSHSTDIWVSSPRWRKITYYSAIPAIHTIEIFERH